MAFRRIPGFHKGPSLGARLLVVWVAILAVSSVILWSAASTERERLRESVQSEVLSIADVLAREDEQLLQRAKVLLSVLAEVPSIANGSEVECSASLWRTLESQPGFHTFAVADADGRVICASHERLVGERVADAPFFRKAVETRRFSIGHYAMDAASERATIRLAHPVTNAKGEVTRVIYSALDLSWLNGFAARVALPEDSQILAWDEQGTVLAAYPDEARWKGQNLGQAEWMKRTLESDRGTLMVEGPEGTELLFAYTGLSADTGEASLHLGIGLPAEAAFGPSYQSLRTHLFALWGAGAVGALMLVAGIYVWMLRPMRGLESAANRIAHGHLDARAIVDRAPLEVARLADSFNAMATHLERTNREREEFIGLAAHELKTPLTTLKLHLQRVLSNLRRATPLKEDQLADALEAAERQTWRLGHLVETILDARSLSETEFQPDLARFDLAEVVQGVAHRVRPSFRSNETELITEIEHAPIFGIWDRSLVERMLGQLLSNALKFGQKRPVILSLHEEEGDVVLTVRDFGIGVDPRDQARIFGRFERAVSSRHHGGLGLGLWVAREIAHKLGGEIELHSEPGMGATFAIHLPRQAPGGVAQDRAGLDASP